MNQSQSNGELTAQSLPAQCWLCDAPAQIDQQFEPAVFYRCTACGFLFAPTRSAAELQQLYGDHYFEQYPGGEDYRKDEPQRRYEATKRQRWVMQHHSVGSLLEIGAAAGFFLDEMRAAGFEVTGIEPANGVAEFARSELKLDVRTGFLEDSQLAAGEFDVICAWHVLEHLRDPQAAIALLRKALRDDGVLLLEIPNIESVMAKRKAGKWFHLDPAHHVAFYNPAQLASLLASAGFELIDTYTYPAFGYVRPGRAIKPREIAAQLRDCLLTRTLPRRSHPEKHELLRAVARPITAA